jgi:uncharacterized protein YutE (UPF0331/DUF86 family)
MIDSDIFFAKTGVIKKCLSRIRESTRLKPESLDELDAQDIFVLNLQRAVQAAIDLAAHVVSSEGLGMPRDLKENFSLLKETGIISNELGGKLEKMVGFRNIAVHDYQVLSSQILKSILADDLKDLEDFYAALGRHFKMIEM